MWESAEMMGFEVTVLAAISIHSLVRYVPRLPRSRQTLLVSRDRGRRKAGRILGFVGVQCVFARLRSKPPNLWQSALALSYTERCTGIGGRLDRADPTQRRT